MALPAHAKYVVIGAGVHGLSTAYHLALNLEATGKGSGKDIVILDKTGVAAGASGIACGVIRNNYFQPAMRELMAECVQVWESDPKAFSYNAVGYMQISPEVMHENVGQIARQQKDIGYDSVFIEGEADCTRYMKGLFDDWQAKGITSVLHEKKGGYANNRASMMGLARKAEAKGVSIISPVKVKGFTFASNSKAVTGIETDRGTIGCDYVVVGVGPWINQIWNMLDLPKTVDIKGRDGKTHKGIGMWTYWCLEEGTLGVDPKYGLMNDGRMGPVMHVDTDAPLHSDEDGSLITDKLWGIYYKPDFNFNGIQGGAMPYKVETPVDEVKIDPYGPESPEFIVDKNFAHMFTSALAFCQKRYSGQAHKWKHEPSGGLGCFTPDSFPVFDVFRENVYVLADSNHGYKMIAVGKLAAGEIVSGQKNRLLEPFRISRFPEGRLHPVSNSPFPWS